MIAEAETIRPRTRRDAPAPITIEGLLPHHNLDAERSLLGAMLADPDHVVDLAREKGMREKTFPPSPPSHLPLYRRNARKQSADRPLHPPRMVDRS